MRRGAPYTYMFVSSIHRQFGGAEFARIRAKRSEFLRVGYGQLSCLLQPDKGLRVLFEFCNHQQAEETTCRAFHAASPDGNQGI
jgi:hypothetical protein